MASCAKSNECSSMMVGENKDGPAPALTGVDPGLTTAKEWLMQDPTLPRGFNETDQAATFLALSQKHLIQAQETRLYFMRLALQHGMSNVGIANALSISEAAVRGLLKRHGEAS